MSIELSIRPATETEQMYTYTQSCQISGQTGCIGHLRAEMDYCDNVFLSTWENQRDYLKTVQFKEEFDQILNRLRFGLDDENGIRHEDDDCFLKNRAALAKYCQVYPSSRMKSEEESYAFRVDTDGYTFMMRLNPRKGVDNLYCYCYRRDWLDQHLQNAEHGIRFIDSHYNTLFWIPDGGKVKVTYSNGNTEDVICRFIDSYHLEFGFGSFNLLHICELAEKMEKIGAKLEPAQKEEENAVR